MSALSLFGLVAVSLMLIFYALESRTPWFVLCFAGACALGSVYGFLQGAWPFGIVEGIWSLVAVRRWALTRSAVVVSPSDRGL
ncbi:MAG TPA: hypothetical protein VMI75_20570 [Polyangiaceae bacterium]|nr:hypothetical protein [Polyangiaceae bacterium]